MAKQIVKYDIETAVITILEKKYSDVKITDGKSYAFVMAGLGEYRGLRLKIDAKHKELKKDALEYGRAVDTEKNRLRGLLEPGETYLKDIRQAEDDRKQAIKDEKEATEQARIDEIQARIDDIKDAALEAVNADSKTISSLIVKIEDIVIDETFQEFQEQAETAQEETLSILFDALETRGKVEKEDAERKAEIEKLEKIRKEQEAEASKLQAEKDKLEADKKAEQERRDREKYEKEVKEKADREAKEKAERDEQERLERERAAAEEKKRQEELRPDKDKLIAFAEDMIAILRPRYPQLQDKKARAILADATEGIDQTYQMIIREVKEL